MELSSAISFLNIISIFNHLSLHTFLTNSLLVQSLLQFQHSFITFHLPFFKMFTTTKTTVITALLLLNSKLSFILPPIPNPAIPPHPNKPKVSLPVLSTAVGTQFITGNCTTDTDCADSCCGFNTGKCAGAIIAQQRDGGCGFGDAAPNDVAAVALGFTGAVGTGKASGSTASATIAAAASTASAATGKQFITGVCKSDAECANGCCGFNSGKCAGAIVAQERDEGCGFGDKAPNDNAAKALTGGKRGVSYRRFVEESG